jgi:gluconolactonase
MAHIDLKPELTEITAGLRFPEGPIAMPDGSVIVVEMFSECLTRVWPDGAKERVAATPGGPNGAAIGPDGAIYLCNNGGSFTPIERNGRSQPGPFDPSRYLGGKIQRVDVRDGSVTDLFTECHGRPLRAPNDLVMDGHGGFWFTDHGIRDDNARKADLTAIYHAACDGSEITESIFPANSPNGIGLSPEGTALYWAETHTGRVFERQLEEPGRLVPSRRTSVLHGLPGHQLLDSLAVDRDGWVCVATLLNGGITAISPDGQHTEHHATGDMFTTNICFGGEDMTTAFVTLSGTGKLVSFRWPRLGLRLAHQ